MVQMMVAVADYVVAGDYDYDYGDYPLDLDLDKNQDDKNPYVDDVFH